MTMGNVVHSMTKILSLYVDLLFTVSSWCRVDTMHSNS